MIFKHLAVLSTQLGGVEINGYGKTRKEARSDCFKRASFYFPDSNCLFSKSIRVK